MALMAGKKKNSKAQYAFIGLILALLGCVATGLIGGANVLVAMGMFTLEAAASGRLSLALQISVAVLILGLAAYAILSPDSVRRFFTGRQARYGSNSLILTLAVLGIIYVANSLAFNNPKSWDMTEDKSNTLAPETMDVLEALPERVTAIAFFSANFNSVSAEELLFKFKANSNGKFDYRFVDPDLDPVAAREAGITGDGKLLLQMGEAQEIASFATETEIVRALFRLINPDSRVIYFLEGHGEAGIIPTGDLSYSIARGTLESKNYIVQSLNLLSTNSIPEDAETIIVAGPLKPVSRQEVELIREYMRNGGSLIVMQDPRFFTEFGNSPDPLADYLESDWGITLNDDVVIDLVNTQNPFQAVSSQYNSHPITANLSQRYIVILPQARSISITAQLENVFPTPLISTTDQSWSERELVANEVPTFDPETDIQGPLTLAAAAENTDTGGRVVVFGNSLFATDDIFDAYGNGNMFINSVDWAAEQEDLLNLTPRQSTPRVFLPPSQGRFLLLVVVSILVIPGMIVFAGVYSWISRRKRG
jgi:ABC-type uncharacterized transport system involved in gliding motility auxiliary subunit